MTATIITFPTTRERADRSHPMAVRWAERAAAEGERYARAVREQAAYGWHVPSLRAMLDLAVDAGSEDMRESARAWLHEQLDSSGRDGSI